MTEKSLANPAEGDGDALSASHFLHPYRHFETPDDVVNATISTAEKRAILANWASGLFAVDSSPRLRHPPGLPGAVGYAQVVAALKALDC